MTDIYAGTTDEEPGQLEGHINAAEYWLHQADIYDFPNPARTECLQLAAVHASLAQALATNPATPGGPGKGTDLGPEA